MTSNTTVAIDNYYPVEKPLTREEAKFWLKQKVHGKIDFVLADNLGKYSQKKMFTLVNPTIAKYLQAPEEFFDRISDSGLHFDSCESKGENTIVVTIDA
jgi:hypothetical protein